jgi:hypothetical protein
MFLFSKLLKSGSCILAKKAIRRAKQITTKERPTKISSLKSLRLTVRLL